MMTMKRLMLTLTLAVSASLVHAQDPNFWIFLCFGQSNMAGSAPIETVDSVVPEGFLSLSAVDGTDGRRKGEWRKAVPPLCRQYTKLSPVDYFGRTVLENAPAGTRVGVVQVAVEGCPITFFDKDRYQEAMRGEEREWMNNILNAYDRNPYGRLVEMARLAQQDGVIKGILLHQGETDAYDRQWQKTVYKIYKDLQHDLQLDSFSVPLLVGEVVRKEYSGTCAAANAMIDDLVNHYHNVYVVTSENCPPLDDGTHFSSEGYRELGRHYAEKYLKRSIMEETKGRRESEVHTSGVEAGPVLNIAADISEDQILVAQASAPLKEVNVVSFSGETIKTVEVADGGTLVEIDLKQLPQETLVFVFKGIDGSVNTVKLEQ